MLTNNTKKPASSLLRNLTVTSDLIRMITKPSKKAKRLGNLMRNYCLRDGDKICLYSRINSQSVKTHYLSTTFSPVTKAMDVCVATQWSPWEIHHVDPSMGRGKALAYGSEVILTNVETGVRSETMILRKVDRGQIMIQTENIPVNQMHKLALQRKNDGYLSARTALSQKGLFENPFSSEHTEEASEVVGDFFLWTIVGVSQFKQSLYLLNLMGQPISKVPTVSDASYNADAGTLRLRISNFFYWDGSWKSYQLWLGERGPWPFTVESVHDQEVELQLLQVYPCAAVLPNDKSWKVCMCLVREDGLLVAATRDGFWLYCNALY